MNSLRTYLKLLETTLPEHIKTIKEEVDWKYGLTPYVTDAETRKTNPAILFENIKDYKTPILTNLFGNVERISLGIGDTPMVRSRLGFYDEWNRLFANDLEPVSVRDGPVKELKQLGSVVDLTTLPTFQ